MLVDGSWNWDAVMTVQVCALPLKLNRGQVNLYRELDWRGLQHQEGIHGAIVLWLCDSYAWALRAVEVKERLGTHWVALCNWVSFSCCVCMVLVGQGMCVCKHIFNVLYHQWWGMVPYHTCIRRNTPNCSDPNKHDPKNYWSDTSRESSSAYDRCVTLN